MKLADIGLVVVGAGIGGGLRFVLGSWMAGRWGTAFPWHTLVINVSGAFLLGVLMALSFERSLLTSSVRLFLGAGVLGGFTTFSTLSYESVALFEQGFVTQGVVNMFGSGVAGLVAAAAGLLTGRAI